MLLGSARDCDVVVPSAEPAHAVLFWSDTSLFLEDMSLSGTALDGYTVRAGVRYSVKAGSSVRLGAASPELRVDYVTPPPGFGQAVLGQAFRSMVAGSSNPDVKRILDGLKDGLDGGLVL